jgi:hypothetical protein
VILLQFLKALPHTTDVALAWDYAGRGSDLSLPSPRRPAIKESLGALPTGYVYGFPVASDTLDER